MGILLIFLLGLAAAGAEPEVIPTYYMHELCGQNINLRRESVFSAKIELLPAAILHKRIYPEVTKDSQGYNNLAHCTLNIESWSFQNRLMVHFEEVTLSVEKECNKPSLEIFDGPTETSPVVAGYPSSCVHADKLMSRSFVTTDRHMTLRFHGNHTSDRNAVFKAIIVSFNGGTCRTYEHQCFNGRCIMSDLVCNGHNPCGDYSDCPPTVPLPREVEKNDHVMLAVIVSVSATAVALLVVGVVVCKCYQNRRKNRRLHRTQYEIVSSSARLGLPVAVPQPSYERTVSQLEAERRYAPPSYSQLPVLENQTETEEEQTMTEPEEPLPNEINFDKCLEPDENNPPSYACVMLYQDAFNVSEPNIYELTNERMESDVTVDAVDENQSKNFDASKAST